MCKKGKNVQKMEKCCFSVHASKNVNPPIHSTASPRKRHRLEAQHRTASTAQAEAQAAACMLQFGTMSHGRVFSIFWKPQNFPFFISCFLSHLHFPLPDHIPSSLIYRDIYFQESRRNPFVLILFYLRFTDII